MGGLSKTEIKHPPATALTALDHPRPGEPSPISRPAPPRPPLRPVRRGGPERDAQTILSERIRTGETVYADLEPDLFNRNLRSLTPENYDDFISLTYGLLGEPGTSHIADGVKHIADQIDQGVDTLHVFQSGKNQRTLAAARAALTQRKQEAADVFNRSGLHFGVPGTSVATFWDERGEKAFDLPPTTAQLVVRDARYAASFGLIGAARRGAPTKELINLSRQALSASAGERLALDSAFIDDAATRADAAAGADALLARPGATPAERQAGLNIMVAALFADAMPQVRAARLVLDMTPLIGNLRAAQQASLDFEGATEAFGREDYAAAAGLAFAGAASALGAAAGLRGGGRLVGRGLARAPGAEFVKASREIGRAQRQGPTPFPARGLKSFTEEAEWQTLKPLQQRYASSLFNHVQGYVTEEQLRARLAKLGQPLELGAGNSGRAKVTLISPKKGRKRVYDDVSQERLLVNVLGFAFSVRRKNWRTAFEAKLNSATKTKQQGEIDDELVKLGKNRRNQPMPPEDPAVNDLRGHNNPPDRIADEPLPGTGDIPARMPPTTVGEQSLGTARNPSVGPDNNFVDEVILLRLSIDQLDRKALIQAFETAVLKPGNAAMKRVESGQWTRQDLENIIDVVREGLLREAKLTPDRPPEIADLLAGVIIRLANFDNLPTPEE